MLDTERNGPSGQREKLGVGESHQEMAQLNKQNPEWTNSTNVAPSNSHENESLRNESAQGEMASWQSMKEQQMSCSRVEKDDREAKRETATFLE